MIDLIPMENGELVTGQNLRQRICTGQRRLGNSSMRNHTPGFLNLKYKDRGFDSEDFYIDRSTDELLILARNLRLDETGLFQSETISETTGAAHQMQFLKDDN